MKKLILLFFILISSININAQKISYGISLGINANDFDYLSLGPFETQNTESKLDFGFQYGVFADVLLKNKFSVKTDFSISSYKEVFVSTPVFGTSLSLPIPRNFDLKLRIINISPKLKYNFDKSISKGMYLELGPRYSNIKEVREDGIPFSNSIYRSENFGIQLGYGIHFLKYFSSNISFDYTISDVVRKSSIIPNEEKLISGSVSLNIHIDSIINN